jgi:predicted DNA-binding transcriptional regulator AlpA
MNPTSLTLLQTVATTDATLSVEQRATLQDLIVGRALSRPASGQALLLSQKDAASMLGISRVTLWRMTKEGFFAPVEILPGTFRYRAEEIEAFARTGKDAKSNPQRN